MNNDLLNILKNVIEKYGRETVFSDPKRISAFFADLARDVPKPQKNAFVKCLEHGFVQPLQNVSETGREDCKRKLAKRLNEEEGLELKLCEEAVDLLSEVLFWKKTNAENIPKETYYIYMESGPHDASVIKEMIANGQITKNYFVRTSSESAWEPVTSLFSFAPSIVSADGGHCTCLNPVATTKFSKLRLIRTIDADAGSFAFSQDGEYIVSGASNNTLRLWNAKNGQLIRFFPGHENYEVVSLAFSPNGRQIVSGSLDKTLKLSETESGRLIHTIVGHKERVSSVVFSPCGKHIVSGSLDKTLRVWETESGQLIHTIVGHKEWTSSVAFSPDGKYIASGNKLWETKSWALVHVRAGQYVYSVAFSPDSKYLVSGSTDETLQLWEVESGHLIRTFRGHEESVSSVAFGLDGRYIVSGSLDNTLKLWETESGKLIDTIKEHGKKINSVALSSDGTHVVSVAQNSTLKIWRLDDDES